MVIGPSPNSRHYSRKPVSQIFLQGVFVVFIVPTNINKQQVTVVVTHNKARKYACDIPLSFVRYDTRLEYVN